jgi:hypothetical protein
LLHLLDNSKRTDRQLIPHGLKYPTLQFFEVVSTTHPVVRSEAGMGVASRRAAGSGPVAAAPPAGPKLSGFRLCVATP